MRAESARIDTQRHYAKGEGTNGIQNWVPALVGGDAADEQLVQRALDALDAAERLAGAL